jgi:hypothetical protein
VLIDVFTVKETFQFVDHMTESSGISNPNVIVPQVFF